MDEHTPKLSSSDCLQTHLWKLRIVGIYRLDRTCSRRARQLHRLYMWLALFLVVLYPFQEMLYAAQVWRDLDKLVAVSFIFLSQFDCVCKLLVFRLRADRIQDLIDNLDGADYLNHASHRRFLQDTASSMRVLHRIFTGGSVFTCFLWAVFPYIDHTQRNHIEFPIWTPGNFNTDETPVFECMIAYTSLSNTLQAYVNTSMDVFIYFIYALCKTHVTILRFNIERLVEASTEIAHTNGETPVVVFRREFKRCMIHYNIIIEASRELQDIFSGVILIQFAVSGWIICMTAYHITQTNLASVEFLSMLVYMICVLIQLYMYCYYGNELTIESDRLVEAAYSMRWLRTAPRERRSTLLFMERATRPIRPNAGVIIPLSMNTFMKILKSSYTFYALLREMK